MSKEALKILAVLTLCGYVTSKRTDSCPTMTDIPEGEGRDVTFEVVSGDCNKPVTGLNVLCINGKGTVGVTETSPGVYQFTASQKNQLLKLAKDDFKTQPLRIPPGDTDLTITTTLSCSAEGGSCSTESYNLSVQLTACEGGGTATPVLSTPEGFPVETVGDGEYQLQLCSLPAVINANVNGYVTQVTVNTDNEQVILSCNGCQPLKLLVSSCERRPLISGATANKALIELETGVYLIDICEGDTQITVIGPEGNQAVVTIPDPIPESMDVVLECPASEASTFGRYFVFTALSTVDHYIQIQIMAKITTNVTISSPAFSLYGDQPFLVRSDYYFRKTLPYNIMAYNSNAYDIKDIRAAGIEIIADLPVSVNVLPLKPSFIVNRASADETVIIPEKYLGTEYITFVPTSEVSEEGRVGTFSVTAIKDNTFVQIIFKTGEIDNVTLNKLDVYRRKGDDLSEAFISASAPVHVQVGHVCAKLASTPNDPDRPCSVLITDLLPIASLKTVYIVPRLLHNFMSLAITAPFDQTDVQILAKDGTVWTPGSVMDGRTSLFLNLFDHPDNQYTIVASKPIQVIQIGREPLTTSNRGAPSMTIVPAVDQYTNFYKVANQFHAEGIVCAIVEQSKSSGLHVETINQSVIPKGNDTVTVPQIGVFTIVYTQVEDISVTSIYHDDPDVNFGAMFYAYSYKKGTATFLGLKP